MVVLLQLIGSLQIRQKNPGGLAISRHRSDELQQR
jgi:hypothetical protein